MNLFTIILVAALTFGVCFLFDKGYTAAFRNKIQHRTGLAVRLSKRYAAFGLILAILGTVSVFTGLREGKVLLFGGIVVLLIGLGLIVYYLTFGVFYDDDTFLVTTFGKKTISYSFRDIQGQQLYIIQGGNVLVELYFSDGNSVGIQSVMEGAYPLLDHAFAAWCRQTGRNPADCPFHDPANHLWFPKVEEV